MAETSEDVKSNQLTPARRTSQRPALSCTECARRKIKCDKIIPCEPCTKRGRQKSCHQEQWIPTGADIENSPSEPLSRSSSNNIRNDLEALRNQVAELEKLIPRVQRLEGMLASGSPSCYAPPPATTAAAHADFSPANSVVNDRLRTGGKDQDGGEDAATTFEYLALGSVNEWGGSKSRPAAQPTLTPPNAVSPTSNGLLFKAQSDAIIDFALESIGWQHPVIHFSTFRTECDAYWASIVGNKPLILNQAWLALYLALLSVGVHHMSLKQAALCGLNEHDTLRLPRLWFNDCMAALNRSDYLSNHTIEAVQTIAVLGFSAYDIAPANMLHVLHGCATRIAQDLQLHRLSMDPPSKLSSEVIVEREIAKRTWWALVTQDWFWIPHQRVWSINPEHFTTPIPRNWRDDDFPSMNFTGTPMQDDGISMVMQQVIMSQVAAVLQNFFARLTIDNQSMHEDTIVEADVELQRILAGLPPALREIPDLSEQARLPPYVSMLRHYLQITMAHKRLVLHRAYLSYAPASNGPASPGTRMRPQVRESRATCVAAARQIIRELAVIAGYEVRPTWSTPYQGVGAATLLMLDVLERQANGCLDEETAVRRSELERGIEALEKLSGWSAIAQRGVSLVRSLLQQELVVGGSVMTHAPQQRQKRGPEELSNGRGSKRRAYDVSPTLADSAIPHALPPSSFQTPGQSSPAYVDFFSAWMATPTVAQNGNAGIESIEALLHSSFGMYSAPLDVDSPFSLS